jgi:hypothetical protein
MKYNLLGAVSTLALGAALGIGTHGAANAGLTCSPAGSANTVGSYTCSESVSTGFVLTPATAILSLDKWVDTASAGYTQTLKSVKWSVSEILSGTGSVTNTDTVTVFGNFISGTTLGATNGSGAPSNFISPAYVKTTSVSGPNITLAAGASSGYSYSSAITSGLKTVSGSLSGFIGPGTFSALVTAVMGSGGFVSTPSGNFQGGVTTSASPTIQLTYAFTTAQPPPPPSPTPEPASLALLGAGLAGLGAVRRRRKG